jgi:hypothetical protein
MRLVGLGECKIIIRYVLKTNSIGNQAGQVPFRTKAYCSHVDSSTQIIRVAS